MDATIASALADWRELRSKTLDFLETLPSEHMSWRPHDQLGTFGMQLRHLAKVQEAYLVGMKTGLITFVDKSFDPSIETDKHKAIEFLESVDAEMVQVLAMVEPTIEIIFDDGTQKKISLLTVLHYLSNHEVYHQGIFTCYGRLAGFGKFTFM